MADNLIIIGDDPVLEESVPVVDPNSGMFWRQVWAGSLPRITLLRDSLALQPDQRHDIDGSQTPLHRLTVITPDKTDGSSEQLNKFELVHNKVEKDVFEFGDSLGIDQDSIEELRRRLDKHLGIGELINPSADFVKLYNFCLKGSKKFLTFEYVFRYTIVTSTRYGVLVSHSNVEKLFTTDQLLNPLKSGLILPAATLFSLRTIPGKANKSEEVPIPNSDPPANVTIDYKWTWLKQPPDFEQLPNGKVAVRQEWWLDLWPTWLYTEVPA